MKAYWIDAHERTVSAVDYGGLPDLKRMVGGYIELAKMWPTGDVLYVDEEGTLKDPQVWFKIEGRDDQLMAGNGVVVGREIDESDETEDPAITLEQLRAEVGFF